MTIVRRAAPPLLVAEHLVKTFAARGILRRHDELRAIDDVSFALYKGESLGLIGESGCGKTTLGRLVLGLTPPTSGTVLFDGKDISTLRGSELKQFRRRAQLIFQNSQTSLNPRRSIRAILGIAFDIHHMSASRSDRRRRLEELVHGVGLSPEILDRYPHELSGGQRQRIVVARAMAVEPELIIADEPVSSLDVSIQAQVLNLLKRLRKEHNLTALLISHDFRVIYFSCDRVCVLYLGRIVEAGPTRALVSNPLHPYTRELVSAIPGGDRLSAHSPLREVPVGANESVRAECVFAPRCPLRRELGNPQACVTERPQLREYGADRFAACHFVDEPAGPTLSAAVATIETGTERKVS